MLEIQNNLAAYGIMLQSNSFVSESALWCSQPLSWTDINAVPLMPQATNFLGLDLPPLK